MKAVTLLLALVLLTGCASKHPYISKPVALGPPHIDKSGDLVRNWEPSQLTPAGCWAHTIFTGGHIAWECRKPQHRTVRIEWRSRVTDATGHGKCMTEIEAVSWLVHLSRTEPELDHWAKTCTPAFSPTGGRWIW